MYKLFVSAILIVLAVTGVHAQQQPYVRKEINQQAINPPGLKMMKIGKTLTIAGGVLLVTGVALIASADEMYYNSTTTQNGTVEEGDPKFFFGVLALSGGLGMTIPGAILWSKGAKKFKAYQENNIKASLSLGINNSGVGLRFRF
jgi:hypothetical protein